MSHEPWKTEKKKSSRGEIMGDDISQMMSVEKVNAERTKMDIAHINILKKDKD